MIEINDLVLFEQFKKQLEDYHSDYFGILYRNHNHDVLLTKKDIKKLFLTKRKIKNRYLYKKDFDDIYIPDFIGDYININISEYKQLSDRKIENIRRYILWIDILFSSIDKIVESTEDSLENLKLIAKNFNQTRKKIKGKKLVSLYEYLYKNLNFDFKNFRMNLENFRESLEEKDIKIDKYDNLDDNFIKLRLLKKYKSDIPKFSDFIEYTSILLNKKAEYLHWLFDGIEKNNIKKSLDNFKLLSKYHTEFYNSKLKKYKKKCSEEKLNDEFFKKTTDVWKKENDFLENIILKIYKNIYEYNFPQGVFNCSNKIIDKVLNFLRELESFYFEKSVYIHQKYYDDKFGNFLEKLNVVKSKKEILDGLLVKIEKLIFKIENKEDRKKIFGSIESLYKYSILGIEDIICSTEQGKIMKKYLTKIRELQNEDLEKFIKNAKMIADKREKIDKRITSLTYKIKKDIQNKKGIHNE